MTALYFIRRLEDGKWYTGTHGGRRCWNVWRDRAILLNHLCASAFANEVQGLELVRASELDELDKLNKNMEDS